MDWDSVVDSFGVWVSVGSGGVGDVSVSCCSCVVGVFLAVGDGGAASF